ncbi:DUF4381 domain-containing protein [Photobacterium galatheae]|uniref:DUF4381 domain-containing protein n=1 Tax=Photobacterium galatheae TaxID=1654360 RepID=A0A066RNQ5_9GAMM|nr:DUF4381 domain-containing protein [Photobacterium galatheae]KDM90711.1 hypothetical protein EA58_15080 [Photobacterium galatheae]MCM0149959.1 DUF4381 domain-containing protein [Photobacterium galatheae]
MTQTQTHPLQLADLHLPSPPDLWPLAWGWWVSALVFILSATLIYFIMRQIQHKRRQQSAKKLALIRLKQAGSVSEINTLLRQTALTYFPRSQVAGLNGNAWLAFLDHQLPEQYQGFTAFSDTWTHAMYAPHVQDDMLNRCRSQAVLWVRHMNLPQHSPSDQTSHKGVRHV